MIEGVRGLLDGRGDWDTLALAAGWCVLIGFAGYLWSRSLFRRTATDVARWSAEAGPPVTTMFEIDRPIRLATQCALSRQPWTVVGSPVC